MASLRILHIARERRLNVKLPTRAVHAVCRVHPLHHSVGSFVIVERLHAPEKASLFSMIHPDAFADVLLDGIGILVLVMV